VKRVVAAGLLVALALSGTGCGFCLSDRECTTGCCVRNQCINDCVVEIMKAKSPDDAPNFGDLLLLLMPPDQLAGQQ